MYDKSLVIEILIQIENAINTTLKRFKVVDSVNYFTDTPEGMEKLAIRQLFQLVRMKNIDKITNKELLPKYPQVDWKGAKGMRDIIFHHYFDVDANDIYFVCDTKLETLLLTIQLIRKELI